MSSAADECDWRPVRRIRVTTHPEFYQQARVLEEIINCDSMVADLDRRISSQMEVIERAILLGLPIEAVEKMAPEE